MAKTKIALVHYSKVCGNTVVFINVNSGYISLMDLLIKYVTGVNIN